MSHRIIDMSQKAKIYYLINRAYVTKFYFVRNLLKAKLVAIAQKGRGTGMIASSSTFCPHPRRVIRDLFHAVYGIVRSTNLPQSSKGSCSLLVSGHNLPADCQWRTPLVPQLNSVANAAPASVLALA